MAGIIVQKNSWTGLHMPAKPKTQLSACGLSPKKFISTRCRGQLLSFPASCSSSTAVRAGIHTAVHRTTRTDFIGKKEGRFPTGSASSTSARSGSASASSASASSASASSGSASVGSGSEGPAGVPSAEERSLEDLKRSLIRAVGGTNRGKNTSSRQRQQILELIEELERRTPTANPIKSPLISGRWALLYTSPTNGFAEETVDKYAGTEEGPFLARVKPLAFGGVRQKGSIQVIDAGNGSVDNIAEFIAFNTPGSLNIKGRCTEADPIPTRGAVRLDVTFESFVLTLGKIFSFTIPLRWVNPKGWVDTTFLDDDVRIGRGDKGSVFVTSRIKQS